MRGTRGTAVADVSMAAHRLSGISPPGSNPTVAITLFRAATGGVSANFVNAANTSYPSAVSTPTPVADTHGTTSEPIPNAFLRTHPHPSSGLPTPATTLARQRLPPTHLALHYYLHLRPHPCRRQQPRPTLARLDRRLGLPLMQSL